MSLIWPCSFISSATGSLTLSGARSALASVWKNPICETPLFLLTHRYITHSVFFGIDSFLLTQDKYTYFHQFVLFHVSSRFLYLMMVMLPGVVYRFTLSVSIWLFLPSVMYEVVTRGLTEPIDFCQQSRNCKNLIKVVGNFDYSCCWRNNPYIIQNASMQKKETLPNSGFTSSEKKNYQHGFYA